VTALQIANGAHAINVNARTLTPDWYGEHLDVGYAIDVLHPLANPFIRRPPPDPVG
jgi:hypothetical protein